MKVVTVTPAGRSDYINILAPYILANRKTVECHQFWMNTDDPDDLQTILNWCNQYPSFFKPVKSDFEGKKNANSICYFYKNCCDPNTVYIRLDDDICWLADDCVEKLLECRLSNPQPFLVSANVINHTKCNIFHQSQGCCPLNIPFYGDGKYAAPMHENFFSKQPHLSCYKFADFTYPDFERLSVNLISWFGRDLESIRGTFTENEEHFMSVTLPEASGRHNMICGSALACHFAYGPQRPYLEANTDYLNRYLLLSQQLSMPRLML